MKKTLLLFVALVASIGAAWADKTFYLNPGGSFEDNGTHSWTESSAVFAAWVWKDGNTGRWVIPTSKVTKTGTTYYKFVVNDEDYVKFTRAENYTNAQNWNTTWNECDASADKISNNSLYTITGWGTYTASTLDLYGSSTFNTIYLHPGTWYESADAVSYAAYAYLDDNNNDWFAFTPLADSHVYTAQIPAEYTNLILNRLTADGMLDWSKVHNQTIDYTTAASNTMYIIDSWNGGTDGKSTAHTSTNLDNLALFGKAKASSGTANNAIDDNISTRWESSSSDPQNWQLDLGASKEFNTIKIVWEAAYGKTFTIEAGNTVDGDGNLTGGTTIATISGQTLEGFPNTQFISIPSTTARYIKFNGTERGTGYGYSFWEFEVYNDKTVTSLTADANYVSSGVATDLGLHAFNQYNVDITSEVTFSTNNGNITAAGVLTASSAGTATITATSTDDFSTATVDVTVLNGMAKTPTEEAEDVLAVYSDTYDATSTMSVGSGARGDISNPGWNGGYDAATQITIGASDKTILVEGVTCFGINAGNADISDYDYLNVSIYSAIDYEGHIQIENTSMSSLDITLTAGQWSNLRIGLSGDRTAATWIQMYVGASKNNTVIIDNVYFSKKANGEIVIPSENAEGLIAISETINSTNKSQLSTVTAAAIDLTGATIAAETGAITTANPNVIFIVTDEQAANISGTANVVKLANDINWMIPLTNVTLTDNNGDRIYAGKSYGSGHSQTVTYTREIAADKYVTVCVPVATDVPANTTAYEFTGYESDEVKFTAISAGNQLAANTAYVLHTTKTTTLTSSVTGANFEINATPAGTTENEVTFKGNYKQLTTDGSQRILTNGEVKQANGAKIGSFRAYFTGLSTPSARAFFIDGDVTKIGTINANGEIEAGEFYNLSGQRVQNPTKGLYIVNGKKVVIK